jgi:hypothetical protein
MKKRLIVFIAVLLMLLSAGTVFAKETPYNGFALGLGYTASPLRGAWAGGMVSFHVPSTPLMFELYPYLSNNGFGITLSGDLWLLHNHIAGIFNWYLGPGLWIDFGLGSQFGLGIGGRGVIGIQAWIIDRLEIFLEAAPGIGLYILPTVSFAYPIPISIGFRWWF